MLSIFKKRTMLFKKRDKETWLQIKAALREAGLKGVQSGHYLQETVMGGGCGAKLDPRDFGSRGRIDREIYWVDVLEEEEREARDILRRAGIALPAIDEDLLLDAALRKKPKDEFLS